MKMIKNSRQTTAHLAALLLLLLTASCTEDSFTPSTETGAFLPDSRIVSVSGTIDTPAATRVQLTKKSGSLDFAVRFDDQDSIKLYIRQGDILEDIAAVPVTGVADEGARCTFGFKVPETIDVTQPATLIAVLGRDPAFVVDGHIYLRMRHFYASKPRNVEVPLAFVRKDIVLQDSPKLDATFEHLGFYTIAQVKNEGDYDLVDMWIGLYDEDWHRPWLDGTKVDSEGKKLVRFLDLETGELSYQNQDQADGYDDLPTIKVGETGTLYGFQIFDPYFAEINAFRAGCDYTEGGKRWYPDSKNTITHTSLTLERGKAFYAYFVMKKGDYLYFADDKETILDDPSVLTIHLSEVTPGETKINLNCSPLTFAYIDRNNNGQYDEGDEADEMIVDGDNFFYPLQKELSLYGDLRRLSLQGNNITSATVAEDSPLVELDLRWNALDAAALNALMESLPVYTWQMKPLLKITGNPGVDKCDLSIAREKGWVTDVPQTDASLPHITISRAYVSYDAGPIRFTLDAPEAVREQCWVDLNNDATRQDFETIPAWGPNGVIRCTPAGGLLTIYGPVEQISLLNDQIVGEVVENTNTALKLLELPNISAGVDIYYDRFTTVEYLKLGREDWPNWREYADLTDFSNLSVLIMDRNVVETLTLPAESKLTYLDLSNADIWRFESIEGQTKLETLLLGRYSAGAVIGRKGVDTADLSGLGELRQVAAINCNLYKEQLATLLKALPDRSGKTSGVLRIAGNPGVGHLDLTIATAKNWTVDTGTTTTDDFLLPEMPGEDWSQMTNGLL